MKFAIPAAMVAIVFVAGAAEAQSVTQTSNQLGNPNTMAGADTVTTVTDATGRTTTATGPGGGANRYNDVTAPADTWRQQNVGGNASVGITTQYARNGNGSAVFTGTDGNSKADLELYFANPVAFSSVTNLGYDAFRDPTSTNSTAQINSLRMILGTSTGSYLGYLIYEPVYNGYPVASPVPAGVWNSFAIDTNSIFWSNNNNLNKPAATQACPDCYLTLGQWEAANPTAMVLGLSTGIGSGWNGAYKGAVDNISFTHGDTTTSWNFEASTAAVPEPAVWTMMIAGLGMIGGVARRRRPRAALA